VDDRVNLYEKILSENDQETSETSSDSENDKYWTERGILDQNADKAGKDSLSHLSPSASSSSHYSNNTSAENS
jgi:hypothetical protein